MSYIINADDFGHDSNINSAIDFCFKKNIISSTTLLANGKAFYEAIILAKQGNYDNNIGLHFNLTEGIPLTDDIRKCRRLCDSTGVFIYKRNSVHLWSSKERKAIKKECLAQIHYLRENGISISHMDSHQHVHTELPIFLCIKRILKKEGISAIRLSVNMPHFSSNFIKRIYKFIFNQVIKIYGFKTVDYFGSFFDIPISLKNNKIAELMIHPCIRNGELMDHVTNEKIYSKKISLINYNNIKK